MIRTRFVRELSGVDDWGPASYFPISSEEVKPDFNHRMYRAIEGRDEETSPIVSTSTTCTTTAFSDRLGIFRNH